MLTKLAVEAFVDELASASPAPGGGSSSALAGAQGAALLSMYCLLSSDPRKFAAAEELKPLGEKARELALSLREAVDKDSDAFKQVMAAFKLPKATDAEKENRKEAIGEAFLRAAQVPLETARFCLEVLELAGKARGKGNPSALSDLAVGNLQAWAGLQGSCYNVQINLPSIGDDTLKKELARQAKDLLLRGEESFSANKMVLEEGLSL